MNRTVEQLKALGEINRFRIVMMLRRGALCVCDLLAVLNVSGATLSSHLKILKYSGLIEGERQGKWIIYRLTPDAVDFIEYLYESCDEKSVIAEDARKVQIRNPVGCA